eukprot:9479178-Alexandrium_andersonii.AAC.1
MTPKGRRLCGELCLGACGLWLLKAPNIACNSPSTAQHGRKVHTATLGASRQVYLSYPDGTRVSQLQLLFRHVPAFIAHKSG